MKKSGFLIIAIGVFFMGAAYGQITGTAHDFSSAGWSGGNICLACHTPHNGDQTVPEAPLWNHAVTGSSFTMYTGTTMDATTSQPSGESLLCLSCHDGTIALDSYGGATGTNYISGTGNLGTDLSNDHPISFDYNTALAALDGGLHDPSTTPTALGGTIDHDLLFGGRMQCSSCHDVHNAEGNTYLLRISNVGSALCLTCHNK